MAQDLHLISDVERQAVVDALRRRYDLGQLSLAELAARTARVNAAPTHAGLESVLMDLPPEPPEPKPATPPRSTAPRRLPTLPALRVPRLQWQLQTIVLGAVAVLAAFTVAVYSARSNDGAPARETGSEPPVESGRVVLLVGRDIEPGRYRSARQGLPRCSWERATGFSQDPDTVIATQVAGDDGAMDVTIVAGERFTSSHCGIWNRIG